MKTIAVQAGAILLICIALSVKAQDTMEKYLPYAEIPEYPSSYAPGSMLSRMIDGLGYRYYWATEGLRTADLQYRPSEDSRTTGETIGHIYDLSTAILNAARNKPNMRPATRPDISFEETRRETLLNLQAASDLFKDKSAGEIESLKVVFQRDDRVQEFPIWHIMNGQIADAIYHTGQVVAFRRASGNPIDSNVNVFMGKTSR